MRTESAVQEHTAAYQWRLLRNQEREGEQWKERGENKTHKCTAPCETGLWNMTGRQKGRQGRGRPYCSNLILRSLIVSCCSCLPGSVCWAYVKHISPLSPGTHTHFSSAFSPHSPRPQRVWEILKGSDMPFPARSLSNASLYADLEPASKTLTFKSHTTMD